MEVLHNVTQIKISILRPRLYGRIALRLRAVRFGHAAPSLLRKNSTLTCTTWSTPTTFMTSSPANRSKPASPAPLSATGTSTAVILIWILLLRSQPITANPAFFKLNLVSFIHCPSKFKVVLFCQNPEGMIQNKYEQGNFSISSYRCYGL